VLGAVGGEVSCRVVVPAKMHAAGGCRQLRTGSILRDHELTMTLYAPSGRGRE
jgi:hypothetical protein